MHEVCNEVGWGKIHNLNFFSLHSFTNLICKKILLSFLKNIFKKSCVKHTSLCRGLCKFSRKTVVTDKDMAESVLPYEDTPSSLSSSVSFRAAHPSQGLFLQSRSGPSAPFIFLALGRTGGIFGLNWPTCTVERAHSEPSLHASAVCI